MREIFKIETVVDGQSHGGDGGDGSAEAAEEAEGAEGASEAVSGVERAVEDAEASGVAPEFMMELDSGSECAVQNAALQVEITEERRQRRRRLLRSLLALNGFIDQPRYQLSCRI